MNWLDAIKGGTPDDLFAVETGRWLNRRLLGPYDEAEAQRIATGLRGKVRRLTMHVEDDDGQNDDGFGYGGFMDTNRGPCQQTPTGVHNGGLGRGGPFR